jgi:CheY-like chemotaxis protein
MRHRVLVVEDDSDIRTSLMDALGDHGFVPMGAANGRDALAKLGEPVDHWCLIILDLMMPVMDGWSFREQQLRDPVLAEIPVVVISAHRDVTKAATDLKADGFLPKPLKVRDLIGVAEQFCAPGEAQ